MAVATARSASEPFTLAIPPEAAELCCRCVLMEAWIA